MFSSRLQTLVKPTKFKVICITKHTFPKALKVSKLELYSNCQGLLKCYENSNGWLLIESKTTILSSMIIYVHHVLWKIILYNENVEKMTYWSFNVRHYFIIYENLLPSFSVDICRLKGNCSEFGHNRKHINPYDERLSYRGQFYYLAQRNIL